MKKIICSLFLSLPFLAFAQQNVDGIGQIRVGRTFSQITGDLGISKNKIHDVSDGNARFADLYHPSRITLARWVPGNSYGPDIEHYYLTCPNAYKLYLPKYEVAGIEMEDLELRFLNDTLYALNIANPSVAFTNAMKTKYGKGRTEKSSKKAECNSDLEEVRYETNWNGENEETIAFEVVEEYRNSACDKKYLNYFAVWYKPSYFFVSDCATEASKKARQRRDGDDKSKLNDF
ncbi:MAG: hypothetical protein EOO16_17570 [Chitinophagaceae bacterium]|nr:MAG: hypothetical protein EOO16_17570 [Chitinophagaceae bacterium]